MSRMPARPRLQNSLWDRLTNPDLARPGASQASSSSQVDRIRKEVLTHLEWLLNTRCCLAAEVEASDVLRSSLVGYGLPDISGVRSGDARDRDRLERILEDVIVRFEPRLTDVRVESNDDKFSAGSTLHYRVSAVIRVKPVAQPIQFDTVLDLGGKAHVVGTA